MRKKLFFIAWACLLPLLAGGAARAEIKAFVSIAPLAYFLERIGGPLVNIEVMVPPGADPHAYQPTPRRMAALAEARVYFRLGMPFEKNLLAKASGLNPDLMAVDASQGVAKRMMSRGLGQGRAGEHRRRGEPDPHIWLSPRLAKIIAANLARALGKLDPAHAADYRRNLAALDRDLGRVDARLAKALAPLKGREFLVFHPAFGYFGDAYGLKQIPVRIEGKQPGPKSLARVIQLARDRHIRVIFVQPQFPPKAAQRIAQAIGGAAAVMDPLARDYLANLERMASELEKALAPQGGKQP